MAIMSKRFEIIKASLAELECCMLEEIVNESIDNLTSYSLKGWISGLHVNYWNRLLEKPSKKNAWKKFFKTFQLLDVAPWLDLPSGSICSI